MAAQRADDNASADPRDPASIDDRVRRWLTEFTPVLRSAIARYCPRDLHLHADEIEQETRIRLWRALERDAQIIDPAAYLYRVAATATIDAIRSVRSKREDPLEHASTREEDGEARSLPASQPSPEQHAAHAELLRLIDAALTELRPERRRAVALHLRGYTVVEIARLLDWTDAKARNLVYRGLDDLRVRLRRAGIDWTE